MNAPGTHPTKPIRVLIVEDEWIMSRGLEVALQRFPAQINLVGEADNAETAVELVRQQMPDVVIIDLNIPRCSGPEDPDITAGIKAIRRIQDMALNTRILVLSGHDVNRNQAVVFDAFRAGAHGYIAKRDSFRADDLRTAITQLMRGEPIYSPTIARLMLNYMRPETMSQSPLAALTDREREVLEFLADGKSNREISQMLVIAETTVKTHVKSILSKLHIKSRHEAAWFLQYLD